MIFILPCSVGGSQCNMLLARRWISSRLVGHGNTRFVGHGHGLDRGAVAEPAWGVTSPKRAAACRDWRLALSGTPTRHFTWAVVN